MSAPPTWISCSGRLRIEHSVLDGFESCGLDLGLQLRSMFCPWVGEDHLSLLLATPIR